MSLNHMPSKRKQQQGSMLVIALFIIVVISLLAASLSRILSSTADSVANEVYSAKAYYASDSGMEYGIYQVLSNGLVCTAFPGNDPITGFDISTEVGFENCSVSIDCQTIDLPDGRSQYYLVSTGTCDGGKIVAEHKVEAAVTL
ncbi:PilX N-terminal domain-containing pilus assembly protein [Moritella sp. Urea-trap-13]|uniref:pilus assembly PilX family protein n=1 Tax=Moritella sp. Urea-trap-13 TaxID=2058327 RepID=UPI000C32569F|nr:PilX N-terminal domain-containing pilus assembly protein [Moritella sp. Urea-trap-13]PKH05142.1 hypothetical protein CXF93_20315 [Moritella sp. Urea-trap-13]